MNRRNFLLQGLAATGAAAAGAGVIERLSHGATIDPEGGATTVPATPPPDSGAAGRTLTADGRVIDTATGKLHAMPLAVYDPKVRTGVAGKKFVMVIDLARCDGCGACSKACSKMHFVPPDRQYIPVLQIQDSPYTAPYFFPKPCYHCDNPPCTKVCPTDATFKREDGIVLIDNDRCIGCRFCMAACPYGARSFNWEKPNDPPEALAQPYSPETGFPRKVGTVEKCDFCPEMGAAGMLPACAASCPMDAIWYGDQNEDAVTNRSGTTARFSKLLADNGGYRHMEELGTEPRVYYLPPKNRMFAPPAPLTKK